VVLILPYKTPRESINDNKSRLLGQVPQLHAKLPHGNFTGKLHRVAPEMDTKFGEGRQAAGAAPCSNTCGHASEALCKYIRNSGTSRRSTMPFHTRGETQREIKSNKRFTKTGFSDKRTQRTLG